MEDLVIKFIAFGILAFALGTLMGVALVCMPSRRVPRLSKACQPEKDRTTTPPRKRPNTTSTLEDLSKPKPNKKRKDYKEHPAPKTWKDAAEAALKAIEQTEDPVIILGFHRLYKIAAENAKKEKANFETIRKPESVYIKYW